jgi:LPXTG-motif cell wall-anchored protein
MKRLIAVLALVAGSLFVAAPATAQLASADSDVCPALSSGKINTSGDPLTVTITAPEGYVIDYYCVKAGSAQQGEGPLIVQVDPPQESVVISYPGGKSVSHYSYHYIKEETPDTPDTPKTPGTPETPGDKTSTPGEEGVLPATGGDDLGLLILAGVLGTAGVVTLTARRFMH